MATPKRRPTQEMKQRHLKLITDLSDYVDPSLDKLEYKQFENLIRSELPPADRKKAKDIMDMFVRLEERGKIGVGKYDIIKTQLQRFKESMVVLIEEAEEEIEDMRRSQASNEPTVTSSDSTFGNSARGNHQHG